MLFILSQQTGSPKSIGAENMNKLEKQLCLLEPETLFLYPFSKTKLKAQELRNAEVNVLI